jgi:hypothetical protein
MLTKYLCSAFWGGFQKAIYALRLKFVLCAQPLENFLLYFDSMYLRLALKLFHFLPDLGGLNA